MIKINLITEKKKRKKLKIKGPANLAMALIIANIAALVVAGLVTFLFKGKVSQLRSQSDANKATLAGLSAKAKEMRKFERLNKEIEQAAAVIEILRNNQSVPVRILDEVSSIIPEGVWLNALSYGDNGVSLEGFAFTNMDIVAYVENLKMSGNMTDVYLNETQETDIDKVRVFRFKLNFKVKA